MVTPKPTQKIAEKDSPAPGTYQTTLPVLLPRDIWRELRIVLTLDGPAGTGKTTVGEAVSQAWGGVTVVDSGKLFRTIGLLLSERAGDLPLDSQEVRERFLPFVLKETRFTPESFVPEGLHFTEETHGASSPRHFSTRELESEKAAHAASVVAQYPEVRNALGKVQAEIAAVAGCVTTGRAQGRELITLLRDVEQQEGAVRVYLHADPEVVARRRFMQQNGREPSAEEVQEKLRQLGERNTRDATRKTSPTVSLEEARREGYIIIDTAKSIHAVVEEVVNAVVVKHPLMGRV